MLFSSITFLFYFLPLFFAVYLIVPRRLKNAVILLASLVFYAWGEQALVLLFALSIVLGWVSGIAIEKSRSQRTKRLFLCGVIVAELAMLSYFKYADFFISSVNAVLRTELSLLHIALPIGISFYTFQILSYAVDVYRGTVPAQKNIIDFGAYVSLFPQLIAGPIVRYSDISLSLSFRRHTLSGISSGIRRFIAGLGKKVLIANVLGEICEKFLSTSDVSVLYCWLYAAAFSLQIYFDFSGYSDMAIGLGRMLGFDFPENFNYPYISKSITEFWRRWHISLGSWFRDYVYIPLGGNRKSIKRQLFNILVVWMLTGLWHGAAWSFVLWGVFFAVLLTAEKLGFKRFLDRHAVFGHIYVIFAVLAGFMLFNFDELKNSPAGFSGMFGAGGIPLISGEAVYVLRSYAVILAVAVIGATPLPKKIMARMTEKASGFMSIAQPVALAVVLLCVTAFLVDGSFDPFLYFRF